MPIQLNSPGWRIRRLGGSRGAARAAAVELPGLPPEFLTAQSRVAEEVVLEPAATTRGQAASGGGLDLSYDLEPGHTSEAPRVRRIKTPHLVNPVFKDFMSSPKLLGVVRDLLGPAIRLHGSKLNLKAPHFGSPVEWHQDWAFYPHTNDDLLAVGVMLDDTTVENGAMYIIPGSHKGPTNNHHDPEGYFCGAMDIEAAGAGRGGFHGGNKSKRRASADETLWRHEVQVDYSRA